MIDICYLDYESRYSSADGYTLKKMSMLEYIRDPRFKAFGTAIALNDEKPTWVKTADIGYVLKSFNWSKTALCAQNVKFDGAIARWHYGTEPYSYIDTLAMSRAVLGCKLASHSLASVAAYFGFAPKGFLRTDGLLELTPEQEAELAEYSLHDLELCRNIRKRLAGEFPEGQYAVMDWTIRCFIDGGFVLNGPLLEAANKAEKERRIKIFEEIGIDKKIFSSNEKFSGLLKSKGYVVPYKKSPKQKNDDGSAKEIPALAVGDIQFLEMRNSGNDELEALCEARIAAKSNLLETRSLKFLEVSKLGVFPFDTNFSGAVNTHRSSGASGAGGNPQNLRKCQNGKEHASGHTIPVKAGAEVAPPFGQCAGALREAVMPPAGEELLCADFNAIEARIVAFIAREGTLMTEFMREGGDPYCAFASEVYQRTITKVDVKERTFGKTCILGLGYGMGADKFKYKVRLDTKMDIPIEEAKRVVALYRSRYERIPGLWDMLNRYIPYIANGASVRIPGIPFLEIRNHHVYLPSGLKLQYPNLRQEMRKNSKTGRFQPQWIYDSKGTEEKLYGGKLLENISQALAGEIKKVAIKRALAAMVKCKGEVHDEILGSAPLGEGKQKLGSLLTAMEAPLSWWPAIVLKAEGGVGPNWLAAKV